MELRSGQNYLNKIASMMALKCCQRLSSRAQAAAATS